MTEREKMSFVDGVRFGMSLLIIEPVGEFADLIPKLRAAAEHDLEDAVRTLFQAMMPSWLLDPDLLNAIHSEFYCALKGNLQPQITEHEIVELFRESKGHKRYKLKLNGSGN